MRRPRCLSTALGSCKHFTFRLELDGCVADIRTCPTTPRAAIFRADAPGQGRSQEYEE